MMDRHGQASIPGQPHPRQTVRPGGLPGQGPAAAAAVNESLLAIAAIADLARLIEPPVAAGRQGGAVRRARASGRGASGHSRFNPIDVLRCRIVWRLVAQLFAMAGDRDSLDGPARRRPRCHRRQVAMYLSHVVLSVPYATVAAAFGRDRTTVMHACAVVEDRRDDGGYDRFIEQCERCIEAVFAPFGLDHAEL